MKYSAKVKIFFIAQFGCAVQYLFCIIKMMNRSLTKNIFLNRIKIFLYRKDMK